MPNTHTTLASLFSDIADSIRARTGSSAQIVADDFPDAIDAIPTGGNSGDVIKFYDYDGTLVETWRLDELASKTALPANPDHSTDEIPLTAQGWNWTLADLKAENRAMNVGQTYVPADGKTHIIVRMEEGRLSPVMGLAINGSVTIDWGDGSPTEVKTGTSLTVNQSIPHTFVTAGEYDITIELTSGTSCDIAGNSGCTYLLRKNTSSNENKVYSGSIQSVYLSSNVSLSAYAFYNCYSLRLVTTPNDLIINNSGNSLFTNCYLLQSYTLPAGTNCIRGSVFQSCLSLKSIAIPASVTRIDGSAFSSCVSLTSITIPSGLTYLGGYSFSNCKSLVAITIPEGITALSSNMFPSCSSLVSIEIPESVTTIGSDAFSNCTSLKTITIPNNVTSIGSSAFSACVSLASIKLPEKLTSISTSLFASCEALKSVTLPQGLTSIGTNAFYGCRSLSSLEIPDGVTSIGNSAFGSCYSLRINKIPEGVTVIEGAVFASCANCTSITLPAGISAIGNQAFYRCDSLASIEIPANVSTIGSNAFQYNYGMGFVKFRPTTPPTLVNSYVLSDLSTDCKILVPRGSLAAYTSATNYPSSATYTYEEYDPE